MLADYKTFIPLGFHSPLTIKFASILEKLANRIKIPDEQVSTGDAINSNVSILLADDDIDDRELFEDIVKEIHPDITVKGVADGNQLMI